MVKNSRTLIMTTHNLRMHREWQSVEEIFWYLRNLGELEVNYCCRQRVVEDIDGLESKHKA